MPDHVKFLREEAAEQESGNVGDGAYAAHLLRDAADELERLQIDARMVAGLLELGDQRLLASDGPCGGQSAIRELSLEEESELYQACRRIAGESKTEEGSE